MPPRSPAENRITQRSARTVLPRPWVVRRCFRCQHNICYRVVAAGDWHENSDRPDLRLLLRALYRRELPRRTPRTHQPPPQPVTTFRKVMRAFATTPQRASLPHALAIATMAPHVGTSSRRLAPPAATNGSKSISSSALKRVASWPCEGRFLGAPRSRICEVHGRASSRR